MTAPAKHTPGPWAAFGDDNMRECNIVAVVPRTDMIARLPVYKDHPNAALIAAAPDLLAALRDVLAIISVEEESVSPISGQAFPARVCGITLGYDSTVAVLDARAAIAKAEGVTPCGA